MLEDRLGRLEALVLGERSSTNLKGEECAVPSITRRVAELAPKLESHHAPEVLELVARSRYAPGHPAPTSAVLGARSCLLM